jgi:hypothetical protein
MQRSRTEIATVPIYRILAPTILTMSKQLIEAQNRADLTDIRGHWCNEKKNSGCRY